MKKLEFVEKVSRLPKKQRGVLMAKASKLLAVCTTDESREMVYDAMISSIKK